MNNLSRLHADHDQSPWIDFIDRPLIESGRLGSLVSAGVRGLTSNPTIFEKAVAAGHYDDVILAAVDRGERNEAVYESFVLRDIGAAADILRPVYDSSDGADGFVSIEVEPDLAGHTAATLARVRYLFHRLARPNVLVKIPATPAGLPAIETALADGINVNVTLLFSVDVYRDVAAAYVAALKSRVARGLDVSRVASVASFFVSRVDTKVDPLLDERRSAAATALRGRIAVANAKVAYHSFREIFHGPEFEDLRSAGARPQRCLWASTSTKDPTYRDVKYVEELIGPETVDTMPPATIDAFLDHGRVEPTLERDPEGAAVALDALAADGIDLDRATGELRDEGVASFTRSYRDLLAAIDRKRRELADRVSSPGL